MYQHINSRRVKESRIKTMEIKKEEIKDCPTCKGVGCLDCGWTGDVKQKLSEVKG